MESFFHSQTGFLDAHGGYYMAIVYIHYLFFPSFQFNSRKIAPYCLMLKAVNFSWLWVSWVSFVVGVVIASVVVVIVVVAVTALELLVVVFQCMRLPLLKRRLDELLLFNCMPLRCLPLNQLPMLRNSYASSSSSSSQAIAFSCTLLLEES
jgi:hypothetical protein